MHKRKGPLSVSLYFRFSEVFDIIQKMPHHTEERIISLCTDAIAAKSEEDIERILAELRTALQEHIRLAKDSLSGQRDGIAALAALSNKRLNTSKA
jgi:hypothetical protein